MQSIVTSGLSSLRRVLLLLACHLYALLLLTCPVYTQSYSYLWLLVFTQSYCYRVRILSKLLQLLSQFLQLPL